MALFHNHAGFNITGNKLQLVEVNYKNNNFYLENIDEEYFDEFFDLSNKETKLISILQSAFDKLTTRKSLNCSHISFALPHDFFKIVELPFDGVLTSKDLKDHFKWELSILFPSFDKDDFIVQHIEISDTRSPGMKKALVIALLKPYLKIIHKFCVRNNSLLKYVDNAHVATNSILFLEKTSQNNYTYLSVYVSEKKVSLMLLKGNVPFYFKIYSKINTSEISTKLLSELENLKKIDINFDLIKQSYIAGEDVSNDLHLQLSDELKLQFIKVNPFLKISTKSNIQHNAFLNEKFNSFTAAAGIAFRLI